MSKKQSANANDRHQLLRDHLTGLVCTLGLIGLLGTGLYMGVFPDMALEEYLSVSMSAVLLSLLIVTLVKLRVRIRGISADYLAPLLFCLLTVLLFSIYLMPGQRHIFSASLFLVLLFGQLRLRVGQMTMLGFWLVIGYGLVVLVSTIRQGDRIDPAVELFHWLLLAIVTLWFVWSARIVARYRGALRREKSRARKLQSELTTLSVHDSLTGAINQRFFVTLLRQELSLLSRNGLPFTLAVFDIRGLSRINRAYGYATGDEVLKTFVTMARKASRDTDVLARLSGEEFVLLMRATSRENAEPCCQRLLSACTRHVFITGQGSFYVQVSAGLVEVRDGMQGVQAIFDRLNELLLRARELGPEQLLSEVLSEPDSTSP